MACTYSATVVRGIASWSAISVNAYWLDLEHHAIGRVLVRPKLGVEHRLVDHQYNIVHENSSEAVNEIQRAMSEHPVESAGARPPQQRRG